MKVLGHTLRRPVRRDLVAIGGAAWLVSAVFMLGIAPYGLMRSGSILGLVVLILASLGGIGAVAFGHLKAGDNDKKVAATFAGGYTVGAYIALLGFTFGSPAMVAATALLVIGFVLRFIGARGPKAASRA